MTLLIISIFGNYLSSILQPILTILEYWYQTTPAPLRITDSRINTKHTFKFTASFTETPAPYLGVKSI